MIKLAITGCMGRMGQQLIKSAKKDKSTKLISLTENRIINKKISGIKPELNTEKAFKNTNVIIDFTVPKCTIEVLKIASKLLRLSVSNWLIVFFTSCPNSPAVKVVKLGLYLKFILDQI